METNHWISELLSRIPDFEPALPASGKTSVGLPGGALPFVLRKIDTKRPLLVVARDELEAEEIYGTIGALGGEAHFMPDLDVIPFSAVFPSPDKLADRVKALAFLRSGKPGTVVLTAESLARKLPPRAAFDRSTLRFGEGLSFDREALVKQLAGMSYIREVKVTEPGSFSIRGDILDVFPPDMTLGVRVSFFGDTVESIRLFHPTSQKSEGELKEFTLRPASEFALSRDRDMNEEDAGELSESLTHSVFLRWYDSADSVLDYAPENAVLFLPSNARNAMENAREKYTTHTPKDAIPLLFDTDALERRLESARMVEIREGLFDDAEASALKLPFLPLPEFGEGFSRFAQDLEERFLSRGEKIVLAVEYDDLADRLSGILKKFEPVRLKPESPFDETKGLSITVMPIEHGFYLDHPEGRILLLSESDLSGKKRLFRKRIRQIDTIFEDIEEIQPGESVVHLNHGIGVFKGIERVSVLGKEKDYILLEFADKEKLFVPLEQSHLIGKYVGGDRKKPALDSLGGKSWAKKREKVQASVEEFARKLVAIYAKRSALQGHSFPGDTVWQKQFEDKFEYIETPDQVKVIEEIKRDMESIRPMERLLCGDVGFGKTEVAMRAAFKAVMDGRQVAVIAPTTVLVEQHTLTFKARFQGFPVRIASVSRFTEAPDLRKVQKMLLNHEIDILIGTHKIFSEKIQFHSLGLCIIDEEHKFGVQQKEIMKERYPLVDFLSLSATPIPRTLNMAMATLRDISLLQTPPDMRIPVETMVSDFSWDLVKYAVEREIQRGGQVYFVHNTIKRLAEYAYQIERLIPGTRVSIGHGQMEEEALDHAFLGFCKGETNVFVCTTIIESGLDIPNANTIIVSDAHRFGLSQLYQLKGRVGRAKRQGYAFFLYPENKSLTENAQKRLFVINEYTDLGAGFNIALQDLEIRGAGNILGEEQHGNIIAVGYDVYMRLLREEVEKLQGKHQEHADTLIDLKYNAFIPDEYISDSATKMEIYKKILSVRNEDEIRALSGELSDRFGSIPAEVSTLFEISRLKIESQAIGIENIIEKGEFIEISFSKYSKVDAVKVMQMKASGRHEITIRAHEKNKIFYQSFDSNIQLKVRRLVTFMRDIREGEN